jgi:hypothetical protein
MALRSKLFDSIFKTRLDVKFVKQTAFNDLIYDEKYQIVDICNRNV